MISSRISRVISVLIHSNNSINPITKMELYREISHYNNDLIKHQLKIETKIKDMETEIALLKNSGGQYIVHHNRQYNEQYLGQYIGQQYNGQYIR